MKTAVNQNMELLAPAGSLQSFAAAMEAGADAVYIGAPELNARNLARHFSLAEITAMVEDSHRRGKKLYVAMNSLAKEEELKRVLSLLSFFARTGVDALIVQDVGISSLARQYFPDLPLHASTLMTAHNSLSVEALFTRGFKRVVLARELTIEEIGAIHHRCPGELEVFVHGAMCFSYSGLCLFSSYQGGKSGLRGRCVQPCRRRYTLEGGKVEGRMRPASYVEKVVRAYRLVLDRPGDTTALVKASDLLQSALCRNSSTGFFLNQQPATLLSPQHSGNTGVFIGKVEVVQGHMVGCNLRHPLAKGDRLRLHREKSGERVAFTLQSIFFHHRRLSSAKSGERVKIEVPGKASKGDSLFLVDSSANRKKEGDRTAILPEVKKIPDARLLQEDRSLALLNDFHKRRQSALAAGR
ncbi:MAG: U32 family peptidase, partial [Deltaproteobacteria bacterium]